MKSAKGTSELSAAPAATTATACGKKADFPKAAAEETSRYLCYSWDEHLGTLLLTLVLSLLAMVQVVAVAVLL